MSSHAFSDFVDLSSWFVFSDFADTSSHAMNFTNVLSSNVAIKSRGNGAFLGDVLSRTEPFFCFET